MESSEIDNYIQENDLIHFVEDNSDGFVAWINYVQDRVNIAYVKNSDFSYNAISTMSNDELIYQIQQKLIINITKETKNRMITWQNLK